MSTKRKLSDTEVVVTMVETVGTQRALQLLGVAGLAVIGGAKDQADLRRFLMESGLYCRASAFGLQADFELVRTAVREAEPTDPGDVWAIVKRVAALKTDLAAWPMGRVPSRLPS